MVKEFVSAVKEVEATDSGEEPSVEFTLDGREMVAYHPTPGQLIFMVAALGRGQSSDQRFSAILNIMYSCLRPEDRDYIEGRLLDRDPKTRLEPEVIEGIFEYLSEEWFARPTQPQSGSVPSLPSTGQNSTAPTTPSPEASSDSSPTDSSD
jgi:hypothetical protein